MSVLDCSRVLAGPVAGVTLASHGADVLRVGAVHLPHTSAVVSTGFGKRNKNIDLRTAEGRESFTRLLADADVLVDSFRPGALRGFDSILQTTTGIALAGAGDDRRPVHLPVQALDHATGFLGAFAALRGLARRQSEGGSWLARLSLLRTRNWLVDLGAGGEPHGPADFDDYLHEVDSDFGRLRAVRPPGELAASTLRWDRAPSEIRSAPAAWLQTVR